MIVREKSVHCSECACVYVYMRACVCKYVCVCVRMLWMQAETDRLCVLLKQIKHFLLGLLINEDNWNKTQKKKRVLDKLNDFLNKQWLIHCENIKHWNCPYEKINKIRYTWIKPVKTCHAKDNISTPYNVFPKIIRHTDLLLNRWQSIETLPWQRLS